MKITNLKLHENSSAEFLLEVTVGDPNGAAAVSGNPQALTQLAEQAFLDHGLLPVSGPSIQTQEHRETMRTLLVSADVFPTVTMDYRNITAVKPVKRCNGERSDSKESDTRERHRQLQEYFNRQSEDAYRRNARRAIAARVEGSIPDSMIETELDRLLESYGRVAAASGMDPFEAMQNENLTPESFRTKARGFAEEQVRLMLACDYVVTQGLVTVSSGEIRARCEVIASQHKVSVETVMEKEDLQSLADQIAAGKAMSFLMAQVSPIEQEVDMIPGVSLY